MFKCWVHQEAFCAPPLFLFIGVYNRLITQNNCLAHMHNRISDFNYVFRRYNIVTSMYGRYSLGGCRLRLKILLSFHFPVQVKPWWITECNACPCGQEADPNIMQVLWYRSLSQNSFKPISLNTCLAHGKRQARYIFIFGKWMEAMQMPITQMPNLIFVLDCKCPLRHKIHSITTCNVCWIANRNQAHNLQFQSRVFINSSTYQ